MAKDLSDVGNISIPERPLDPAIEEANRELKRAVEKAEKARAAPSSEPRTGPTSYTRRTVASTAEPSISRTTAMSVNRPVATLNRGVEKAAEQYLLVATGKGFLDNTTREALIRQTQALEGTPEVQVLTMTHKLKGLTSKMSALRDAVTTAIERSDPSLAGDPDASNRAVDGEMVAILKNKQNLLLRGEGTGVRSLDVANKELDDLISKVKWGAVAAAAVSGATEVASEGDRTAHVQEAARLRASPAIDAATQYLRVVSSQSEGPNEAQMQNLLRQISEIDASENGQVQKMTAYLGQMTEKMTQLRKVLTEKVKQEHSQNPTVQQRLTNDPTYLANYPATVDRIVDERIANLTAKEPAVRLMGNDIGVGGAQKVNRMLDALIVSVSGADRATERAVNVATGLAGGNSGPEVQPPSEGVSFSKLVEQFLERRQNGTGLGGYNNGGPPQTPSVKQILPVKGSER